MLPLRRLACVGDWVVYYEQTKVPRTRGYFAVRQSQGGARPEDDDQSDGFTRNLLSVDFFAYCFTNSGLTASLSESVPL